MGAYGLAPREEARLTSGIGELLGILSPHALHPDGEWSFAEGPRRMLTGRRAGAGALLFQPGLKPLRAELQRVLGLTATSESKVDISDMPVGEQ